MKRMIFGALAILCLFLGFGGLAHAQDYNGNCAQVPSNVNGNATITDTNCVISTSVTATGNIWISATTIQAKALTAQGGPITITGNGGTITGALTTSAQNVWVDDHAGSVTLGAVNTTSGGSGGTIQIYSDTGAVKVTGALTTTATGGTQTSGYIEVWAVTTLEVDGDVNSGAYADLITPQTGSSNVNQGGSSSNTLKITGNVYTANNALALFAAGNVEVDKAVASNGGPIAIHANVAGTSGSSTPAFTTNTSTTNGVGQTINAGDGSSSPNGGIYLTNGGNGGFQFTNATDLVPSNGGLIVDACNENDTDTTCSGKISIGPGNISSDGSNSTTAGIQLYIGNTISLGAGTLSASDSVANPAAQIHYITLSTTTLNLGGNLIVNVNGDNPVGGSNGGGSIEFNNLNANSATDGFVPFGAVSTTLTAGPTSPLTITGSGTATLNSTGQNQFILFQGKGLTYSAGQLNITTNDASSEVDFYSPGSTLAVTGSSSVAVTANGANTLNEGGTINLNAGTLGTITPNIKLDSSGSSNGQAGFVNLNFGSGNIKVGTSPGSFQLISKGGNNKHTTSTTETNCEYSDTLPNINISLASSSTLTFDTSSTGLNASAVTGSGNQGGCISISTGTVATQATTTLLAQGDAAAGGGIRISASTVPGIGAGSGSNPLFLEANGSNQTMGGYVYVKKATNVDYTTGILVSPPSSVTSETTFAGKINLNGVTCQQWLSEQTTWPTSWWDCVHPSNPNGSGNLDPYLLTLDESQTLNTIRSTYTSAPVQQYYFASQANYKSFLNYTAPANSLGYTTTFGTSGNTLFSAIFGASLTTHYNIEEITAHELGHATLDNNSNQATSAGYLTYVADDYLFLDYTVVGTSDSNSTHRQPCVGTGAVFAGLNDESTGLPFCRTTSSNGYTLITIPSNYYIESKYVSNGKVLRNSQIVQKASKIFAFDNTYGWKELYTQSFAFEAYVSGANLTAAQAVYYTTDPLMEDAYFECATGWSYLLLQVQSVPPTTSLNPYGGQGFPACNNPPQWYRTLLGH